MEKLDIKHTCPGCGYCFVTDRSFALHIGMIHEPDFYDNIQWIKDLPDHVYEIIDGYGFDIWDFGHAESCTCFVCRKRKGGNIFNGEGRGRHSNSVHD